MIALPDGERLLLTIDRVVAGKRVKGWITIELVNNVTGFGQFIGYKYWNGEDKLHSSAPHALEQIAEDTVRRYLAGTLPDAIADNLAETEVE